jgi:nucleotide-binding universal stress UspA family protein
MYQRILVPIDGSATAEAGLDEAIKIGKLSGATLRLIHVLDQMLYTGGYDFIPSYSSEVIPLMRKEGLKTLQSARAKVEAAGLKVETQLLETFAARVPDLILDDAKACGADLLVIGTHGRRGMSRLVLGSAAEQVVRQSPVPVLLVRGQSEPAADKD